MRGKIVRAAHSVGGDSCDYSVIKRRSGIELVIECGDCGTEPGLENPGCFKNVLQAIQKEGVPVAITLRSHVERRYGVAATGTMCIISEILNRVESLQSQLSRDSGRSESCGNCLRPLSGKLTVVGRSLSAMNLNIAISSARDLDNYVFSSISGCSDCIGITSVQVSDIVNSARNLEKTIVRGAFNIVEAD